MSEVIALRMEREASIVPKRRLTARTVIMEDRQPFTQYGERAREQQMY